MRMEAQNEWYNRDPKRDQNFDNIPYEARTDLNTVGALCLQVSGLRELYLPMKPINQNRPRFMTS